MHRHSYQGRKLSMGRDQRLALVRGQITALVLHEQLITTIPKAKEIAPQFDQLVTRAKKGDLASSRALRQVLYTENAVQKMIQELVPAWNNRSSGYTRIVKLGTRRGDNANMAQISLILPPKPKKSAEATETASEAPEKPVQATKPATATAKPQRKARTPKTAATSKETK